MSILVNILMFFSFASVLAISEIEYASFLVSLFSLL